MLLVATLAITLDLSLPNQSGPLESDKSPDEEAGDRRPSAEEAYGRQRVQEAGGGKDEVATLRLRVLYKGNDDENGQKEFCLCFFCSCLSVCVQTKYGGRCMAGAALLCRLRLQLTMH